MPQLIAMKPDIQQVLNAQQQFCLGVGLSVHQASVGSSATASAAAERLRFKARPGWGAAILVEVGVRRSSART